MGNAKKTLTFEQAIAQLEQSVSELESGSLTLDEALATFEQGIALVKQCRKELERALKFGSHAKLVADNVIYGSKR